MSHPGLAPPATAAAPSITARRRGDRGWGWLAAVAAACLAVQLLVPLATLPRHLSWDYGEGWNAYWAARVWTGQPLYTGPGSPITNNYPPLSFLVMGAAGRLAGDMVVGGRLVALAALGGCAALVGLLVARLGGGGRWAGAAAGGLVLYVGVFAWRYLGNDDPQWLAALASLGGLALLVRRDGAPPTPARLAGAALLMVVGGLVKHNQLAAPLAVTLWLCARDRRHLLPLWLALGLALAGGALAAIRAAYGAVAIDQLLRHQRTFDAAYLLNGVRTLSGLLPEMGLAWMLRRRARSAPGLALLLWFALAALPLGLFERTGAGVSANAHFDAALALMTLGGVALGSVRLGARLRWRFALLAACPLVVGTVATGPAIVRRLRALPDTDRRWQEAAGVLRAAPGPVACELPALCFWAGRPFTVDFFNYGQKLRRVGDPAGLGPALRDGRFAALVVVRDARFRDGDGRLPAAFNAAIARRYRPAMDLPGQVFVLARR